MKYLFFTLSLALAACGTERSNRNQPYIPHDEPAPTKKKTTCWEEVECKKVFLNRRLQIVCQTFNVCEEEHSTENMKYLISD